jgi:hypothetical protein
MLKRQIAIRTFEVFDENGTMLRIESREGEVRSIMMKEFQRQGG